MTPLQLQQQINLVISWLPGQNPPNITIPAKDHNQLWGAYLAAASTAIAALATSATAQTITARAFAAALVANTGAAHFIGSLAGRAAAAAGPLGQPAAPISPTAADIQAAVTAANHNRPYAQRFAQQATTGTMSTQAISARGALYIMGARGSVTQAWKDSLPPNAVIDWLLNNSGEVVHCSECPRIAAEGPYTPSTLWTTPGAGDTPCRAFCNCTLQYNGHNSP